MPPCSAILRAAKTLDVRFDEGTALKLTPRLALGGFTVGSLAGFFGIGGGFLVVPGLVAATAMPILNAVGSSLVSVTAFGTTTAANYAIDGMVDWRIALFFIAGGAVGGYIGNLASHRLGANKRTLSVIFALAVMAVGIFISSQWLVSVIS